MRMVLNVSVVLACGALAGVSSLLQSAPTRAAVLPAAMASTARPVPMMPDASAVLTLVKRSGGVEAHFEAANTTHDGHLTRDQAEKADWSRVAKHFDEIDADHRGWITVDQIHAFNRLHRAHRKGATA